MRKRRGGGEQGEGGEEGGRLRGLRRERERDFIVKYCDKSSGIRTSLFWFAVEERRGSPHPPAPPTLRIFSRRLQLFYITSSLMCYNGQPLKGKGYILKKRKKQSSTKNVASGHRLYQISGDFLFINADPDPARRHIQITKNLQNKNLQNNGHV